MTLRFTLYCDHQTTDFTTRYLTYIKNCAYTIIIIIIIDTILKNSIPEQVHIKYDIKYDIYILIEQWHIEIDYIQNRNLPSSVKMSSSVSTTFIGWGCSSC